MHHRGNIISNIVDNGDLFESQKIDRGKKDVCKVKYILWSLQGLEGPGYLLEACKSQQAIKPSGHQQDLHTIYFGERTRLCIRVPCGEVKTNAPNPRSTAAIEYLRILYYAYRNREWPNTRRKLKEFVFDVNKTSEPSRKAMPFSQENRRKDH